MPNFSLRGIAPDLLDALKVRAAIEGSSVNSLILRIINEQMGGTADADQSGGRRSDLDQFVGCWSDEEARQFHEALGWTEA